MQMVGDSHISDTEEVSYGTNKVYLSPKERCEFYSTMKHAVVIFRSVWFIFDKKKEPIEMSITGGGFTLNKIGYIITVAHNYHVDRSVETRYQFRRVNDIQFWNAKLVYRDMERDVAIFKIVDGEMNDLQRLRDWKYGKLGNSDDLFRGTDVITISHPNSFYFTMAYGELALDSYRLVGDVREKEYPDLYTYPADLPVLQISNFHSCKGSSGSPVFDCNGFIVGMIVFVFKEKDFAIPMSVIRDCITTYEGQQDDGDKKGVLEKRKRDPKEKDVNPKRKRGRHGR